MNAVDVDASEHYDVVSSDDAPSTLAVIIDTNPRAWATLSSHSKSSGTIDSAIASLLVFVNAHLAYSNSNEAIILAAHPNRAEFLFPPRPYGLALSSRDRDRESDPTQDSLGDVVMTDAPALPGAPSGASSANKYPQFAQGEAAVVASLRSLLSSTEHADYSCYSSQIGGALSLALARLHKSSQTLAAAAASNKPKSANSVPALQTNTSSDSSPTATFRGRIFVLSVSDSEPAQYVPTINAAHAAAHMHIQIDALALAGQATFLQQASSITGGSFSAISVGSSQQGLLAYLMLGFAGDPGGRSCLVPASSQAVDFRGACFCHGRLVSEGFVCSTCLSIFCEPPADGDCLTCGVTLALGRYGAKPAVIKKRKKKRTKPANGAES